MAAPVQYPERSPRPAPHCAPHADIVLHMQNQHNCRLAPQPAVSRPPRAYRRRSGSCAKRPGTARTPTHKRCVTRASLRLASGGRLRTGAGFGGSSITGLFVEMRNRWAVSGIHSGGAAWHCATATRCRASLRQIQSNEAGCQGRP